MAEDTNYKDIAIEKINEASDVARIQQCMDLVEFGGGKEGYEKEYIAFLGLSGFFHSFGGHEDIGKRNYIKRLLEEKMDFDKSFSDKFFRVLELATQKSLDDLIIKMNIVLKDDGYSLQSVHDFPDKSLDDQKEEVVKKAKKKGKVNADS